MATGRQKQQTGGEAKIQGPRVEAMREAGVFSGFQQRFAERGLPAGIRSDNGIWLVSFLHYNLGYIDLEQRNLQTIDNPFGTRLSPMP